MIEVLPVEAKERGWKEGHDFGSRYWEYAVPGSVPDGTRQIARAWTEAASVIVMVMTIGGKKIWTAKLSGETPKVLLQNAMAVAETTVEVADAPPQQAAASAR